MELVDRYCIVRSTNAGVFAGTVTAVNGDTVAMKDARRLWYWDGAASLSELAMKGVAKPQNCKFPVAVAEVIVLGVCEIIPASDTAKASVEGVPEWTAK